MSRFIVVVLVGLVCLLGACNTAPMLEEETEEQELRILTVASTTDLLLSDFIDVFEERYPDVTVQVEYFTPYAPALHDEPPVDLRQLIEDYRPDIVRLSAFSIHNFSDQLLDLTPFVEVDRIDLDDFYPALIEGSTVQGNLKAIPLWYGLTMLLYYNEHVFDLADLDYPSSDWTWEEMFQLSGTLELAHSLGGAQESEVIGLHFPYLYLSAIESILLSYGAQLFSPEDGRAEGLILRQENRHRFFYRACAWCPSSYSLNKVPFKLYDEGEIRPQTFHTFAQIH